MEIDSIFHGQNELKNNKKKKLEKVFPYIFPFPHFPPPPSHSLIIFLEK